MSEIESTCDICGVESPDHTEFRCPELAPEVVEWINRTNSSVCTICGDDDHFDNDCHDWNVIYAFQPDK